jgi:hypothetical protein
MSPTLCTGCYLLIENRILDSSSPYPYKMWAPPFPFNISKGIQTSEESFSQINWESQAPVSIPSVVHSKPQPLPQLPWPMPQLSVTRRKSHPYLRMPGYLVDRSNTNPVLSSVVVERGLHHWLYQTAQPRYQPLTVSLQTKPRLDGANSSLVNPSMDRPPISLPSTNQYYGHT